jgi:hypothetical protein
MAKWIRFSVLYDAESENGKKIKAWLDEQPNVSDSVRKLILGQPLFSEIQQEIGVLKQMVADSGVRYGPIPEPAFPEPEGPETEEADEKLGNKKGASMFFDD